MDTSTGNNNGPGPIEQKQNPESIEAAYKVKCVEMKKRLNDIEAQNATLSLRNMRGRRYIQKMRLESCFLMERLDAMMNETDPNKTDPELRTHMMAMMEQNGGSFVGRGTMDDRGASASGFMDDASDGSGEERPPTVRSR